MRRIKASFYDGKTSEKTEVELQFYASRQLRISGLAKDVLYELSEVRITPRLAKTPRSIYLPDGARCEALDNEAIDAVLRHYGIGKWQAFVHKLESKFLYVLIALVITIVAVWGLVAYGVPALAEYAAHSLPPTVDIALGRQGLSVMDRLFFSPSELSEQRLRELDLLFMNMTRGIAGGYTFRLELRKGNGVGPNAFALPSGIIVLTDELVLLTKHKDEQIAILAHEIGHLVHRHALRRLLQDSTTALIVVSITGDVTSIGALSAALPTLLIEAKYSRDFEWEADQYALKYLKNNNIAPKYFADILLRLEKATPQYNDAYHYLSSHPATRERLRVFQDVD